MLKVFFLALPLIIFLLLHLSRIRGDKAAMQIPTHAERHKEFRRVMDENPWMKIYYALYGIAVVIGVYCAFSLNINVAAEIGFWGFTGALAVLLIPIFIYKLKQFL